MRTYLQTLLHRKRGTYGPLWLFELAPATWAIVWDEWLEDDETCRLILQEDPKWFNRDWGRDGRRPNPTYKTSQEALDEIIRSLQAMKADLSDEHVEQSRYSTYIKLALQDQNRALGGEIVGGSDEPSPVQNSLLVPAVSNPLEAPVSLYAVATARESAEPEKTPPVPAAAAAEPKKPWEVASSDPTAVNFKPEPSLHAKMEWVSKNVPGGMSRLKILREGAALLCDQLIEKYYRQ